MLLGGEPRWAPPLRAYERWLVSRRHPYRRVAALDRWLVRRRGDVVGRVAAHHVEGDEVAWFGGFECADDLAAVEALMEAAFAWAAERGAARLAGPALYLPDDGDAGVLIEGFEHPGGTARPWHPPWYVEHLDALGFGPWGEALPRWRLATTPGATAAAMATGHGGGRLPPHAGRLADRRLVLPAIAAVPDVSAVARGRRLRRATEAAVVHLDAGGDPAALVPALLAAAHGAGYEAVWSPWTPDGHRPPDTAHRLLTRSLT